MPNEAANQELKQENLEAQSVSTEPKIENPYSRYFSNPEIAQKIQDQINTYKIQNTDIEKSFIGYLEKNPQKTEQINKILNNSNINTETSQKLINIMIDASVKETTVFPQARIEPKMDIDTKIKTIGDITKTKEEKQNTITKKIEVVEKKDQINKRIEEVEAERQSLIAQNPSLDIKSDSPQYLEASKKLEASGTIKLLSEKGLSAENISKFISFKATQEAIQSDPKIKGGESFLLSFKKLENELNIPDANRDAFSSKHIEQTSAELFHPELGNQNLIDTVSTQKKAHAEDVKKLFEAPQNIQELNDLYGKFLPESQQSYIAIQQKEQKQIALTETEQTFLSRFKAELETKKTEFEEKTANSMEQAAILGPIMGLADYMDIDIGNAFQFNKSNDIKIDNGILSISGHIDNNPFTLETNLDKPSKLKTSDYLNKTDEANFGIGNQNRQETAYIMPAQRQIWDQIKTSTEKTHQEILKNTDSLQEYETNLQKNLCENVKQLYGYKELVQARIEKQMTKNIAAQETLNTLNQNLFNGQFEYGQNIGKNENPILHNFLKDLDYSLENLSADEIKLRRQSIQELALILKNPEITKNADIIKKISPEMLKATKKTMQRISSGEDTKTTLFSFFSCLKDPKTKTYQVTEFFNLLQENKKTVPNEKTFPHISENRNKETADENLERSLFGEISEIHPGGN